MEWPWNVEKQAALRHAVASYLVCHRALRRQLLDHHPGVGLNPDLAVQVYPPLSLLREGYDECAWSASVDLDESSAKFDLEDKSSEDQRLAPAAKIRCLQPI
jgi:hypothetical protein